MDEALAGHASFIEVELGADGFLTVTDNGRGIPVDPHPKFPKKSALEVIMCTLHSGGKFNSKVYETSGGLHGVGVSVVNALSSRLEVEVARSQKLYRMSFERGHPKGKLEDLGKINNRRGTTIRFKPDTDIFGAKAAFKPQRLFKMARSKAYLFGGVEIRWRCDPELLKGIEDVPAEDKFHFPGGLKDYLAAAIHADTLVHPDIFSGKSGRNGAHGACEWAVAWTADADGFLSSYCNTVPTPDGGTHESGMRSAHAARPEGSRRARRPGQARRLHHLRRRDGRRGRDALGVRARAGIPGPDQGPPGHRRSPAHRRTGHQGSVRPLAVGQSAAGQQAAGFRHRARRRAAAPPRRKGNLAQDRGQEAAPARQARRLHQHRHRRLRTVHRRGRLGRRQRQAGARPQDPGDPAAARQDPQRRFRHQGQAHRQRPARRPDAGDRLRHRSRIIAKRICATRASSS